MASQDNFDKKMPLRPDFKTMQKMMAEMRALKTSSSSYKKQMEDLVDASKRFPPSTKEEVPEDPEANLLQKEKKPARTPAPSEAPPASAKAPVATVHLAQVPRQPKKKMARPSKEVDFLGTNSEESVREVLEALPPETTVVAVVHNKYWTEEWRDHTSCYTVEDLAAANSARVARALSTSIQLEGLVKDLNSKREDLAKCLKEAMQYGDKVREARAKAAEEEKKRTEAEAQLAIAVGDIERLKKELYEVERQVAAMTRRMDHANEHHQLVMEALEASNKEKAELRQRTEAQSEEIASLNEELKSAGEVTVQNFIDHFEVHPMYDDFANFWASWSAQGILGRLKEVHPTLDISSLEAEFGGPI
ncbi:uncharacterized protein LOC111400445 [Olea europaea var. sylvestris]|uniref:uncharacterized protein LOC111400445 n=1 Tax=Olea europaea var. sylvestris TaxID=158386 RepID=UPI000C1CDDDB|nr:uncharacterized protein LOC111400445 [Olea europaea var. sylvestris]